VVKKEGATKAAELTAQAQENRVQNQFAFRGQDSYVLNEDVDRTIPDQASIPQEVLNNYAVIQQKLIELTALDFRNPNDFRTLTTAYNDIINRINHPYIGSNEAIKKQVMENLGKITLYTPEESKDYQDVINLLINAMTNAYLIDQKNQDDITTKEEWYNKVIVLGDKLLRFALLKPSNEIIIPSLYGSYLWVPGELTNGKGWITFQAKGQHDLFICFSQDIANVQKKGTNIYEIDLGGWNNTKTDIRVQSLGRAAASTTDKKLLLRALRPQSYWINFDNGTITLGGGQKVGENIVLTWKDPAPWQNIKYIGLGSWDAPVTLSQLKTIINQGVQTSIPGQTTSGAQDDADDEEIDLVILSDEEDQANATSLAAKKSAPKKQQINKAVQGKTTSQPEPQAAPTQQQTQAPKKAPKKAVATQTAAPVSNSARSASQSVTQTHDARDANVTRRRIR
jgi:hypothetical protein